MSIIKQALRELKSPVILSMVKIAFPTITVGTWLGYFVGTPLHPLWFYVAWPFIAITALLFVIFCAFIIQKANAK